MVCPIARIGIESTTRVVVSSARQYTVVVVPFVRILHIVDVFAILFLSGVPRLDCFVKFSPSPSLDPRFNLRVVLTLCTLLLALLASRSRC